MIKRLIKSTSISLLIFMLVTVPILASSYTAIIRIINTESEYDHTPAFLALDNDYLIENGYVSSDEMLDVKIDDGNNYLPMMPTDSGVWFCPSTIQSGSSYARWTSGNEEAESHQIVIGDGGYIIIPDDVPLDEPTITTYGYLKDTDGYIYYADDSIELGTNGAGDIEAIVYGTLDDFDWEDSLVIGDYVYLQSGSSIWKVYLPTMTVIDVENYGIYDYSFGDGIKGICENGTTIYFIDSVYNSELEQFDIYILVIDSTTMSVSTTYNLGSLDLYVKDALYYNGNIYIGGYNFYSNYYDYGLYKINATTFAIEDSLVTQTIDDKEYKVLGNKLYRVGTYIYTIAAYGGNSYVVSVSTNNMAIYDVASYGANIISYYDGYVLAISNDYINVLDIMDLSYYTRIDTGLDYIGGSCYVDETNGYLYLGIDGIAPSPSIYKVISKYDLDTFSYVGSITQATYFEETTYRIAFYSDDLYLFNYNNPEVYQIDLATFAIEATPDMSTVCNASLSVEFTEAEYTILLQIEDGHVTLALYSGESIYDYETVSFTPEYPNAQINNYTVVMGGSMPYMYYFKIMEQYDSEYEELLYQPITIISDSIMPNLGEGASPPA